MSRALDDLDPRLRPLAIELVARCVEAGVAVMIVDTLRTPAEHAVNLAKGTSAATRSKHLDGLAIDLCPYETYQFAGPDKLRWDAGSGPKDVKEPWATMGRIGESLGLRWGGRWKKPFDPGHFEYVDK